MPPETIDLDIDRPVAGGRMLGRHEGRVVLVAGAIPGERVRARLERTQGGVTFARVIEVLQRSPDRRDPGPDPACGGMDYAHVALDRQRALKAEVVRDGLARLARVEARVTQVHASPERGYRMRVRLHCRQGRLGSFREGTHEVCDASVTRQLLERSEEVVAALAEVLRRHRVHRAEAIEIAENLDASERVVHFDTARDDVVPAAVFAEVAGLDGVTGVTRAHAWAGRVSAVSGTPWVADALSSFVPLPGDVAARLRRRARAFFQANRFLAPTLVQRTLARLGPGPVVDLYAGVGLFALSAAAAGHDEVVAVEGEPVSAADLDRNAADLGPGVSTVHSAVEDFLARRPGALGRGTLIVDPPRTGISREAMTGILESGAPAIVYVSCDVATFARDCRRLLDAGYQAGEVEAFDLFPNTGHVEVLTHFVR